MDKNGLNTFFPWTFTCTLEKLLLKAMISICVSFDELHTISTWQTTVGTLDVLRDNLPSSIGFKGSRTRTKTNRQMLIGKHDISRKYTCVSLWRPREIGEKEIQFCTWKTYKLSSHALWNSWSESTSLQRWATNYDTCQWENGLIPYVLLML
jgi:hypothetical protein